MAKEGVMIIDDTAIEKFGVHMENASEVRISGGKINIGYVAFLACVYLPSMTVPKGFANGFLSLLKAICKTFDQ